MNRGDMLLQEAVRMAVDEEIRALPSDEELKKMIQPSAEFEERMDRLIYEGSEGNGVAAVRKLRTLKRILAGAAVFALVLLSSNIWSHAVYGKSIYGMFEALFERRDGMHVDTSLFKRYDQSYTIDGYTITLKYGLYSELVESGYCIFDVLKESGAVEEPPQYIDHQIVDKFGDGRFALKLSNGIDMGISRMYAEMNGDHLRVYYIFKNPDLENKEFSLHSKVYLYYSEDEEGSKAGKYAFTLEDYAGDRIYELDEDTKVYISYLSVYIFSKKHMSVKMEAVMENGQRKTVFTSGDGNSGEGVTEDGGKVLSAYYEKTFNKLFPVDQIKELYLNGKKLEEITE